MSAHLGHRWHHCMVKPSPARDRQSNAIAQSTDAEKRSEASNRNQRLNRTGQFWLQIDRTRAKKCNRTQVTVINAIARSHFNSSARQLVFGMLQLHSVQAGGVQQSIDVIVQAK